MMNKENRMNKLQNAGVNTNKYFTLDLPNGISAGSKIHVVIENGVPVIKNDVIAEQIIADGYVRNTKLHRRFVMAQMFKMLNYKSYNGREQGYTACLNRYSIKYAFDMMLEEVRVLSKLEDRDTETFNERSKFFTKDVIIATMNDYILKLRAHIDASRTYNCKGVAYKKVKGKDIFVADLWKKVYQPLEYCVWNVKSANNYKVIYSILKAFMSKMIKLPHDTAKCKAWVDAYKGEGAFYTLKNLIMFHHCGIDGSEINCRKLYGAAAMSVLNKKLNEYQGQGWRMFAFMNKVIADNNFDFYKVMNEIYND